MNHDVDTVDDGSHYPTAADSDLWQESWCLCWYDPIERIGGFHHIGLQRLRNIADAWSWITVRGESAHKFHDNELQLPSDDFSNLKVGPFHLQTVVPLMERTIAIRGRDVSADLKYEAKVKPISLYYDSLAGNNIGRNHYEDAGRLTGVVHVQNQAREIQAFAFQDRTWGPRDWSTMLSYRAVWACFGEDLFLLLLHMTDPSGSKNGGYVCKAGRLTPIRASDVKVEMQSDGVSPAGVRATAWTASGEGLQFEGTCDGGGIQTHRNNFLMNNSCCLFKMGGRVGTGWVEVVELKALTPALQAYQDSSRTQVRPEHEKAL